MQRIAQLLPLIVLLGSVACARQESPTETVASSDRTIIVDGTVVDSRGSQPIRDGSVVIVGDRITFVGRAVDYPDRDDAQILDAQGGTILPGFVDAHVHSASDPGLRREFLINGVTTVCDLGSPLADMPEFDELYLDADPAARGYRAGPIITAPGGLPGAVLDPDLNYEVGSPAEARAAVRDLNQRGADFIKVYIHDGDGAGAYPMIGQEELVAIVDEAHKLGLLVRPHVTFASLLSMAIAAGVDVVEHVPANVTQAQIESISEAQWQRIEESDDPLQLLFEKLYPQFPAQLEQMVQAGIIMIPTLDRPYGEMFRASDPTVEQRAASGLALEIVRRYHELGGVVGLGTDFNVGLGMPAGIPLGEIEMLQAAGLTPMDVIEAGTRHAAEACGQGDQLGTLAPGMLADIIVVDGDPLQDLGALSQVVLVIRNGELGFISE